MSQCPAYRLRLFLSVDLVGSTAYKARFGEQRESNTDPNPVWVTQIRHFYREFPKLLTNRYRKLVSADDGQHTYVECCPQVWKTIGDEIVFCCRLHCLEHLACCVAAFLRALDDYGTYLDFQGKHLDVKGSAWTAAFPAPNVTVEMASRSSASFSTDQIDEEFEEAADNGPATFDFLGKEIDAGFRAARNSAADRLTATLELAWLLAEAVQANLLAAKFSYHGRQTLKGVIRDRPYPVVTIDAERNLSRRELRQRERAVTHESDADPLALREFLRSFMQEESIDFPVLGREGGGVLTDLPKSYREFENVWNAIAQETQKRSAGEKAAADEEGQSDTDLPESVNDVLKETVAQAEASQSGNASPDPVNLSGTKST